MKLLYARIDVPLLRAGAGRISTRSSRDEVLWKKKRGGLLPLPEEKGPF